MGHEARPQIAEFISHLTKHDRYPTSFESFYIDATKAFYEDESSRMAKEMKLDPAGFTIHCIARVQEEVERAEEMLPEATLSLVRATVENSLIEHRVTWIASQGMQISHHLSLFTTDVHLLQAYQGSWKPRIYPLSPTCTRCSYALVNMQKSSNPSRTMFE